MKKATFAGIALVAFLFTFICLASPANADAVSFDLSGTLPSSATLGGMNFAVTSAGRTAGALTLENAERALDSSVSNFAFGANGSFAGDTVSSPSRMGVLDFWGGISVWTSSGSLNDRTAHFGFFRRWTLAADPPLSPSPTPEPSTLLLLGTGLMCVGISLRRRSFVS